MLLGTVLTPSTVKSNERLDPSIVGVNNNEYYYYYVQELYSNPKTGIHLASVQIAPSTFYGVAVYEGDKFIITFENIEESDNDWIDYKITLNNKTYSKTQPLDRPTYIGVHDRNLGFIASIKWDYHRENFLSFLEFAFSAYQYEDFSGELIETTTKFEVKLQYKILPGRFEEFPFKQKQIWIENTYDKETGMLIIAKYHLIDVSTDDEKSEFRYIIKQYDPNSRTNFINLNPPVSIFLIWAIFVTIKGRMSTTVRSRSS